MVDLMDLLRDVLVCSLQVWMLNDFGKNMFPYRVGSLWKRIGVYFAAALCIFIANHMGTTLFNIKWIQKFINLLQGFFYAQYCPFGQEDERKIEQEICNLLKNKV